jgi:FkbH-like protein
MNVSTSDKIKSGYHPVVPASTRKLPREAGDIELANMLVKHRHALSLSLLPSISNWDKWADKIDPTMLDNFAETELYAFIDYLALLIRTGDVTYRDLYIGEKLKQLYSSNDSPEEAVQRRKQVVQSDQAAILEGVSSLVDRKGQERLARELDEIGRIVTTQARQTLNVLLIGDCLHLDIVSFLTAPLLEEDIALNPTFVTTKNPIDQRNALRAMRDQKFDLIFYSPFTYEFDLDIAQLGRLKNIVLLNADIQRVVDNSMSQVAATLDVLSDQFECDVFVHNTANIRRHDGSFKERAKCLFTYWTRRRTARRIDAALRRYVTNRRAGTLGRVFMIDELPLLAQHGEQKLGETFYNSLYQHPATFGKWLAAEYRDIISTQALLKNKKLVVCDLDNTLWEGIIGEGKVQHYAQRQDVLKQLRKKGILLAVCSKNESTNVHFTDGVLGAEDFVSSMINWDPKPSNIKRIAEVLNLKIKDFVFIDDRQDEREMVTMAMPEIYTLDACSERTWRRLGLWADHLHSGEDRTAFYKQREQREGFLKEQAVREDPTALYQKLGIEVTIRIAGKADQGRVVELINRTNQFNTCGSRTTVKEIAAWSESNKHKIFLADASDKFGSMGTICILIAQMETDQIFIPMFVLSCRVFGYGIERAMLNHVKRLAQNASYSSVIGLFKKTPHNQPCRQAYPENGFEWDNAQWIWHVNGPIEDPVWLRIIQN